MWIWSTRFLLLFLVAFEFLNLFGILRVPLTFTWWGLIVTSLPVWVIIELCHSKARRTHTPFPEWVLIIIVFAVYVDAVGDILGLYDQFYWWDQVAHVFGTASATAGCGIVLAPMLGLGTLSSKVQFIIIVAFGMLAGTVYELAEYTEDLISQSHRLGDGLDTGNDLLLDLLGAVLVAAILLRLHPRHSYDRRSHPTSPQHS